jgi:hypothetical protein
MNCCALTFIRSRDSSSGWAGGLPDMTGFCSRRAVVRCDGLPYCRQHDPARMRAVENRKRIMSGYKPRPAIASEVIT